MKKLLAAVLMLIALHSTAIAADAVVAPHWQIVQDKSSIGWTAQYSGKAVNGTFPDFSGDIAFDSNNLAASHVSIKIVMAKVKSDDGDAQSNLPESDWFDVKKFPEAVFEASNFTHGEGEHYTADGTLTIRDKSVKVSLPFTLKIANAVAVMDGSAELKRLDFGVGQGDWAKTDAVADGVKVAVHLEAKKVP